MSSRDEFGAFLVGFVIGGLSGAVAALLFAPQTGAETRVLIKDKSVEMRDRAQAGVQDAIARAEAVTVGRADQMARRFRELGRGAPEPAESAVNSSQSKVKQPDAISEPAA